MILKQLNCAGYLRLSKDDGEGESASIKNQRRIIMEFAKENGLEIIKEYCDDGFSGTNFDRPGFKALVEDIKKERINVVIVKDLSRLGRDYIETGKFTEKFFPENGVRFIAVNDGIDTDCPMNDLAPFRNVINEMYARDTSRKIRSALYSRMKSGIFVGSASPYGYECKNGVLVKGEKAQVVEFIFKKVTEGNSAQKTAEILNLTGELSPLDYRSYKTGREVRNYGWSASTVRKIIKNPVYKGVLVQGKTRKPTFKSEGSKNVPDEMRFVTLNAHEKIISDEVFEMANRLVSINRNSLENNPLAGFLFCAKCGAEIKRITPFAVCENNCLEGTRITKQVLIRKVNEIIRTDFSKLSLGKRGEIVENITVGKNSVTVKLRNSDVLKANKNKL